MNWPAQDRWERLMQKAGATGPTSAWYDRLTKAYAEPQRHYHNQEHIAECLEEFDRIRHEAKEPQAVELALWFHDAIYDPKGGNNEELSAELASQCLRECGIPHPFQDRIARLILVTKNHETGADADAKIMIDVDLSILGRDERRFNQYEEQIRQEYAWVTPEIFGSKRAEILERFLAREHVFSTDWFRRRFEKQARKNLDASIRKLKQMAQLLL
ncbi:MAG TPA: N-methyl-D-aspartate receptor NMDAR2C subunit [Pseudomonadales bacterium]|nr:N-methyl-D-aspartate receptor NMDAR2C subunit [Pseudomonadales bacterium]